MSTTIAKKLAGKTALVTGASKGIGAAIAKHLAAAGASVAVNYASSKADAARVVGEITAAGGKATAIQADVSKKADVDRLFTEATAALGRIDILVNNAGVYEFAPLENVTEEHFHRQFNLNVLGLLLASQKAAAQFDTAAGGVIINVSSVVSTSTPATTSVYSATKASVDAITTSLAAELGPRKIRVNAVNPGLVTTEGVRTAGIDGSDFEKQIISDTPLGRAGLPDDIARVATFLASDDSGWVTGQTLVASGGFR